MSYISIVHYLGLLLSLVGGVMAVPAVFGLVQHDAAGGALTAAAEITIICGGLAYFFTRKGRRPVTQREALVIVVAAWFAVSAFGALPYYFSGALPTYLDSVFETMSGFTTTGATVMTHIGDQPDSILLWRSLTQWLGGMGIIMLFVALFPLLGIGAAQMAEAEMTGEKGERLTSRITSTAKALWLIYFGFTLLCFGALLWAGLPLFDSVNISLTTLPSGGFAPVDLSIEEYASVPVQLIVNFFMFIAGVNFALFYYVFMKGRPGKLFRNPEFKLYAALLAAASIVLALDLTFHNIYPIGDALRQGAFQATTIMTSTGYSSANFDEWPNLSRALILILMVIGGSAGSTAGGLKVIRSLILFKYTYRRIILAYNPNAVIPIKVGGIVLPEKTISRTVGMTVAFFAAMWGGFLTMSALGLNFETALSSVATCLGNVGPGLAGVGPYENFAWIPGLGKIVLIIMMLAGRLELFTLLILLTPAFWRRY
ncbi:TrkH family potassium uptake protein [Dehalogenimonas alkenigignens]|uniref:TrkH family potassium uptake protein n=1 Tax=Dehalogenimonas alkenigignens TaxID=1217799 RepID=UPI000D57AD16|nr:TrkH family potassium uptake protein [Dehalogenimonas alkenigignens]PVV83994.1 potassium transporter [Dehalogenimonas alkenigignens]